MLKVQMLIPPRLIVNFKLFLYFNNPMPGLDPIIVIFTCGGLMFLFYLSDSSPRPLTEDTETSRYTQLFNKQMQSIY